MSQTKTDVWNERKTAFLSAYASQPQEMEVPTVEEIKESLVTVNHVYDFDENDSLWVNLCKIPLKEESKSNNTEKYRFSYIDKFNELSRPIVLNGRYTVEYANGKETDSNWLKDYMEFHEKLKESFDNLTYMGKLKELTNSTETLGVTVYKYGNSNRVGQLMHQSKELQDSLDETSNKIHEWLIESVK